MQKSVCVISEDLSLPLDEGIKHFAHSLVQAWAQENRVLGISVRLQGEMESSNTVSIKTNRLLLSYKLAKQISRFNPELICYVPSPSATIFSFIRSRVLKLYHPRAKVIMISLQPRQYGSISRPLVRLLSPDMVFVQHEQVMEELLSLGCRAGLLPSGVNLEKFKPISAQRKVELRNKYGLDPTAFTVLHVGHITAGRGIELLTKVQREHSAQVLLISSSLVHWDRAELTTRLRTEKIIILEDYISDIEEIYQLSDCYIFPVFSDQACIGTPLSVLEAMACNLPVISVRYGTLPTWFQEGEGLLYVDTPKELVEAINQIKNINGCKNRDKVTPYSWGNIAQRISN